MKLYQNKDWLYQKYWIERLSIQKIARLCEISDMGILYWMQKHKLERRTKSEANIGRAITEETRKRMSNSHEGQIAWNKGLTAKDDFRILFGEEHGMYGKGNTHKQDCQCNFCKKLEGKNHPNYKPKIKKICVTCGRSFYVIPSCQDQKNCFRECRLEYSKGMLYSFIGRGKSGHFYSQKNKKQLHYRSSYELQAYKILEQLSKVIKYESEPFYISYRFQEIEHNYIPDILVTYDDGSQELIEVMAEWQLEDKNRIAKFKSAQSYCDENNIKFSIWTENKLFREN